MKNFDRIARYLSGEMPPVEQAAFEKEMREDEQLRLEVEAQRLEEELLNIAAEEHLRRELESVQAEGASREPQETRRQDRIVRMRHRFPVLAAAASLLLLVVAVYALLFRGRGLPPGEVADLEYIATPPDFSSVRGAEAEGFADPLGKYENWIRSGEPGAIRQAADTLELASEADPAYPRILFLLGHAYYRLGRFGDAAARFQALEEDRRAATFTREQAAYYELLSRMKGGEEPAAFHPLLDSILADPGHAFYRNAKAVEQKLK